MRLDAKRRTVANLLFGWESATCKPDDVFLNVDEQFGGFPLAQRALRRRVRPVLQADGGGQGKVATTSPAAREQRTSGSVRVTLAETDATGATTVACDSETIPWSAVTG